MPNGSYHGAQTTASAERSSARHRRAADAPAQHDAVLDAELGGQRAQPAGLGVGVERGQVRTARHVQLGAGHGGERGDRVADALALDQPARDDEPVAARACAARPGRLGVKRVTSTPHGTTLIRRRSAPRRTSSNTSSEQVAMTRSARRAMSRSVSIRCAGLVSLAP